MFLLLLAFKFPLGTLNYPLLFAVCLILVLRHFLTKSDLVNPVTTFMKDLQESQDTENFHKKVEFFYWSFLERFNFLLFLFLALFKDETFVLEYEFLFPLKMYACFFLLVTSCINLIILYVFNPSKVAASVVYGVAKTCLVCITGGGILYTGYELFDDRCLGGVKDPGTSTLVVMYQKTTVNCTMPTAEYVRVFKAHRWAYGTDVPVVPGTRMLDANAIQTKFDGEQTPVVQKRITDFGGKFVPSFPPIKKKIINFFFN